MDYCFFTPSYRYDLDRLLILRASIRKFIKEPIKHYILVPKKDYYEFKRKLSADEKVILLIQNDFVSEKFYPSRLYSIIKKIFPNQLWRFEKNSGRPGWIIQQIVKFSIPTIIEEDIAIILDSDIFFIKPLSIFELFETSNNTLLMRRNDGRHKEHIRKSREILKAPEGNLDKNYMTWPAILYKKHIIQLQDYLYKTHGKTWQDVLFDANTISEYSIYGIFIEEIAKPQNLKIINLPLHIGIWSLEDFNNFLNKKLPIENHVVCFVVQSNLGIPIEQYREKIEFYLGNN